MVDDIDVLANPAAVRPILGFMPDFFGVYDDLIARFGRRNLEEVFLAIARRGQEPNR